MVITERRRGSNFFQGVGVSKETHITCDFPGGGEGGVRTPSPPPLDPHVGSPDATVCLQNHQNLNKNEKYHPTTKRKKAISCWCGSRGGSMGPDPPGKSQVIWVSKVYKQLDPPPLEKVGHPPPPPLENVGPPLEP